LVVAHISQQNNSLELAQAALAPVTAEVQQITFACQNQGFDWLSVS
jgi:phosphoribosyl 1,2-cyclic phosphodiesterase